MGQPLYKMNHGDRNKLTRHQQSQLDLIEAVLSSTKFGRDLFPLESSTGYFNDRDAGTIAHRLYMQRMYIRGSNVPFDYDGSVDRVRDGLHVMHLGEGGEDGLVVVGTRSSRLALRALRSFATDEWSLHGVDLPTEDQLTGPMKIHVVKGNSLDDWHYYDFDSESPLARWGFRWDVG